MTISAEALRLVDPAKFSARVVKSAGCWLWTGNVRGRYGICYVPGVQSTAVAHRVAYVLAGREIPAGLQLDHLCRNTLCVNPDHLEPVTLDENMRRRRRDTCKRGHKMPEGDRRHCGTCNAEGQRRRRAEVAALQGKSTPADPETPAEDAEPGDGAA